MSDLSQTYPEHFFDALTPGSLFAARTVLPILRERYSFNSIVDIGCGVGAWLLAAQEVGCSRVAGVDGPHVLREVDAGPAADVLSRPAAGHARRGCALAAPAGGGLAATLLLRVGVKTPTRSTS